MKTSWRFHKIKPASDNTELQIRQVLFLKGIYSHKVETCSSNAFEIKTGSFGKYLEAVKTTLAVYFEERKKVNRKSKEVLAQETSKH